METLLFAIIVAAVAILGLGLGLALAPRLTRWDDRRSRIEKEGPVATEGEEERD
jgi:hypothetical protein